MASETTPLTSGEENRTYLFLSQRRRTRRTKIRQFQCCVCAAILGIFVTAMVVTVSYSMNHDTEDNGSDNETDANDINVLQPAPVVPNQLNTLLTLTWPLPDKSKKAWTGTMPTDSDVAAALEAGQASLKAKDQLEARAQSFNGSNGSPGILKLGTPSYTHQQAIKTTQEATNAARVGYVIGVATQKLASKIGSSKGSVGQGPPVHAFWLPTGMICPGNGGIEQEKPTECPSSPYRTIDGSCNNLVHSDWGVTMRPFRRMLPPDYGDGVAAPRLAKDGSPLPSARDVSLTVHRPIYRNDPHFTVMLAVWGQFFDHDITATALSKSKDGAPIACCTEDGRLPPEQAHPECYPVVLSEEDPYYSDFSMTCMEFIRSAPSPTCNFGPREQMNQITSFIDASVVYGSSEEQAMRLRSPNGKGELHMMVTPEGRELLPPSTDPRDGCNTPEMNKKGKYCFMSGDSRANENMHLTTMHLLLAREHNRLVRKLSQINPTWDDEKLYQEGRKIVSAQLQHITYKEFLPVILGKSLMEKLKLEPQEDGYFDGYNPETNPAVANNFATAAFRFAHTLLPTLMKIVNNDTSSEEYVELHKMLFNPYDLYYADKMDSSIKGALSTDIQRFDTYLTPELTQHLFQQRWSEDYDKQQEKASNGTMKKKKKSFGLDLASINVQRGRDHGLPSYTKWRQFCGLSTPKSFSDLQGQMDDGALQRLATLFKSVEDVDLYSGSLSEIPIGEGLLGPTFSCLIADQFLRLKTGDRYWYETSEQPQAFTPEQLKEIRKISLAAIICDNSGVDRAQPAVMRTVDVTNPRMPCTSIPRIQIEAWQDKSMIGRVQVSLQSVHPRAMPMPENLAATTTPKASRFIKGTVLSASITAKNSNGNSVTLLDPSSSFPIPVPLHLFDQKINSTTNKNTDGMMPLIYKGPNLVSWTGTLTITDYMKAHAQGNFTAPFFIHGPTPFDFSMTNYTGDFDITIKLENNASFYGLPQIQGTYNSGINFRTEYTFMKSMLKTEEDDLGKGGSPLPQAPILLYGSYTMDGKSFNWNGNISLVLPPPSPTPGTKYLTESKSSSDAVLVTATSGLITATSGPSPSDRGSKTVITKWWDGTFPVAIPQPAFDRIISSDFQTISPMGMDVKPESGITWSGSLSPVADSVTGNVLLNGTYSFPVFTHGPKGEGPSLLAEKFWRGNFSLILQPFKYDPRPLTSSLSFLNVGQFKTPIFFRAGNEEVKMPTLGVSKGVGPIVPVILHGYTSLDKSVFFWTGNATIVVPHNATNEDPTEMGSMPTMKKQTYLKSDDDMKALSSYSIPLDLNILSATVDITVSTSPKVPSRNISWNGEFPLTIPQPAFYRSTPPPTTSLSKTPIDDDYPYYSPLAKAGTYKSGVTWSNISAKILNTTETEVQINGSLSFPIYYFGTANEKPKKTKPFWTGPTVETWNGAFSTTFKVNVSMIGNETLDLFMSIISGGQFTSTIYFSEKNETLKAYERKSPSKPISPMEVIILLRGSKSSDKTEFYWNGEATLLIPILSLAGNSESMMKAISISKKLNDTSNSYFMGSVASGNILATSSKAKVMLWNGELPLAIEMPAFDAVSPNAAVWRRPYTTPFYNGTGGVTWSGTITKSSELENRVSVKGDFSVPIFVHGNPSAFEVVEWNGDFQLDINLNINRTGSGTPLGQGMYNSPIFFREINLDKGNEDTVMSEIKELLGLGNSTNFGSWTWYKTSRVPLILWGNYSADHKVFYWGGNISAIFPPVKNYLYSTADYVAKERAAVSKPDDERRVRLPVKVLSGSISVSATNFPKQELWDGKLPVAIPTSFFLNKGELYLGGPTNGTMKFAPSDSTLNGAQMEGLLSIPVFTDSNISTIIFHKWSGEFSLILSFPEDIDFEEFIPNSGSFVCHVYLGVANPDDHSVSASKNNEQTIIDYMLDALPEFSYTNAFRAPLVLLGEFSPDKKFFYWSGDAALHVLPKLQKTLSRVGMHELSISKKLTDTSNSYFMGSVASGNILATSSKAKVMLWNGELPLAIEMPAFDAVSPNAAVWRRPYPTPFYNGTGGVTWSGTITKSSELGNRVSVKGDFSVPIFVHGNPSAFEVVEWSGDFQLDINLNINRTGSGTPLGQGMYNSPIFFREINLDKGNEDTVMSEIKELLGLGNSTNFGSWTWYKTSRVPLILWGNYSADHKVFYWGGNISAIFPPVKNYLYSTADYVAKERAAVSKPDDERRVRLPVKVLSGSISVSATNFPKQELWDGKLPVAIPTSFFLNKGELYLGGPTNGTMKFAPSDSTLNGAQMEGLLSIPVFTDSNISTIIFHKWSGEFSLILSFPEDIDFEEFIPNSGSFVCHVYLGVANPDDHSVSASKNNKQTIIDYMLDALPEFSYTNAFRAPLVLLGEFSPDKKFFYWSGDAALHVLPKLQGTLSRVGMNQLSPLSSVYSPVQRNLGQRISGTVTAGKLTGGIAGNSASTLWDGSFPANIPMPAFNKYSNITESLGPGNPMPDDMQAGLTWQLTSVSAAAGGVQVQGTFAFPVFVHGYYGSYSVTLWKGDFSFTATLPGDQSIAMLTEGSKYSSGIYFQRSWDSYKLREENHLSTVSALQTAQKSVIILKGTRQKSSFLWSGKFVVTFS